MCLFWAYHSRYLSNFVISFRVRFEYSQLAMILRLMKYRAASFDIVLLYCGTKICAYMYTVINKCVRVLLLLFFKK